MDKQQHATTIWQSGLWDAALWVIAILWSGVMALATRTWRKQEQRIDELEAFCIAEHKQRGHDLTQHAVVDVSSHDAIKDRLAVEIDSLHKTIDDKTNALSVQMTSQHNALASRIDNVLNLMVKQ